MLSCRSRVCSGVKSEGGAADAEGVLVDEVEAVGVAAPPEDEEEEDPEALEEEVVEAATAPPL